MKSKLAIAAGAAVLLIGCEVANPPSEKAEAVSGAQPTEVAELASEEVSPTHTACIKASGGVTAAMLQCSHDELDRQDARLNANYKEAMDSFSDKSGLRSIQRQWIKDRDATCAIDDDGGTAATLNHIECLVQETKKRADQLGGSEELDQPEVATAPMHADWFDDSASTLQEAVTTPVAITGEAPVTVYIDSVGSYPYPTRYFVVVRATADAVAINSVSLNRGNCRLKWGENNTFKFPHTLKFGEAINVPWEGCDVVIETAVSTNLGDYAFSFDPM